MCVEMFEYIIFTILVGTVICLLNIFLFFFFFYTNRAASIGHIMGISVLLRRVYIYHIHTVSFILTIYNGY